MMHYFPKINPVQKDILNIFPKYNLFGYNSNNKVSKFLIYNTIILVRNMFYIIYMSLFFLLMVLLILCDCNP